MKHFALDSAGHGGAAWRTLFRTMISAGALASFAAASPSLSVLAAQPSAQRVVDGRLAEGQRLFTLGRFEEAAAIWSSALQPVDARRDARLRIGLLARRSEAYQALGFGPKAVADLERALKEAEPLEDRGLTAGLQGSYGNALMLTGALLRARSALVASLKYATAVKDVALQARTQNNLGNVLYLTGSLTEAEHTFRLSHQSAMHAGNPELAAMALLNAARVTMDRGRLADAATLAARAMKDFEALPNSHGKAMGMVGAARLLAPARRPDQAPDDVALALAYHGFQRAQDVATAIGDDRVASQAFGGLGRLYEDQGRYQEALRLTRRALFRAQKINAAEILYLWHWQAGRLHRALGNTDVALRSYRAAVVALRSIRSEFLVKFSRSRSIFPDTVKPVFTDLVDLLLRHAADPAAPQPVIRANLREAQQTMELLKTAELEDYYQDECVESLQGKVKSIEKLDSGTAALYPIILNDRTELLITLPDSIVRMTVPVDEQTMIASVRNFREKLVTRTTREFLVPARRLHDWLIKPIEAKLTELGIKTLVVIPSGALRTVPLAPLFDGNRFLIEKFALSIVPGLTLLDPRPFARGRPESLLSGLTQPVQGFPALPYVDKELTHIHELFGGKLFKDKDFVTNRIQRALSETSYSLVHFASHAQFSADSSESFLLTFDGRLSMDGLEKFVKLSRFRDKPVELLTLSACETASGDERAALGLAGIAVKAGARSALASLWFVNDQSTSRLVSRFYEELKKGPRTKAEALQRAQISILQDARYRHPFFWSAFILIGNWL